MRFRRQILNRRRREIVRPCREVRETRAGRRDMWHRDDPEVRGVAKCALQRGDERRGRRVAFVGRLREREGKCLEEPIVVRTVDRRKAAHGGVTKPDRTPAGEELECDDGQGENVGSACDGLAVDTLRRGVRPSDWWAQAAALQGLCDAEVDQQGFVGGDEDVARMKGAVQHTRGCSVVERTSQVCDNCQRVPDGCWTVLPKRRVERLCRNVRLREPRQCALHAAGDCGRN